MTQSIDALINALNSMPEVAATTIESNKNVVYTGCGDSLASAYVASRKGARAYSAGDIEWMEEIPAKTDVMVGISNSGTSGATIRALRRASEQGCETVAITASPDSVMASEAKELQLIPPLLVEEQVPVAGHLALAIGVAATCGYSVEGIAKKVAVGIEKMKPVINETVAKLPKNMPSAITVLSLPELRSAGNFATLKFMEATGIAARDVPLEECGHVDYFVGPQDHLVLSMRGTRGKARFERLERALDENGQSIIPIDFDLISDGGKEPIDDLVRELVAAVVVTFISIEAATLWNRPPFRGGAVNMDASHIKIEI
ncbi:SIS domain-containing protein [Actinomyces sp.]|uniref:SIS domain-containing protein n=1 Tax=Actinomyces sp. TaxID=29317 RepID=UPI0029081E0C|nr:SIS domain-containing protein [Actinomyces sp.]MDU5569392.1 SIS domain-containing protein [Actinomyces sp.]MDU7239655.1 SIS domain-containing protein [Actinomyces sp.]